MTDPSVTTRRRRTADCPLIIVPEVADQWLEDWIERSRDRIKPMLLEHKALLFRGFRNRGGLDSISNCLFEKRLQYIYRSTPRTDLGQYIYTASEYPRQLTIPQHCENSYQLIWPMRLLLHCVEPATKGGRTPLTDTARVTAEIASEVKDMFARDGVRYVRNYRAGVDVPWEEVFGTDSKAEVERFCSRNRIDVEWKKDGLRTTQICPAFATHPDTGDELWFNQAHLFHISSLEPVMQKTLLGYFGEEGLPRNAYRGDGSPIPVEMLEHIRSVYRKNLIVFDWSRDDVVMIDNMLVSHGREPYEGPRKVLVCMAEPYSPYGVDRDDASTGSDVVKLYV